MSPNLPPHNTSTRTISAVTSPAPRGLGRQGGALHSSLRIDPASQPSAQEFHIAQIFQEAEAYGIQRGQLLMSTFETRVGDGGSNHDTRTTISDLDAAFSTRIRDNSALFAGQEHAHDELVRIARLAQDTTIYEALSTRFFNLGQQYGEAQGREIEDSIYQDARQRLHSLGHAVAQSFSGAHRALSEVPQGVALSEPPRDNLEAALLAAARLGERVGIDRRISAEIDATHIYRAVAGWKEFLPTWFPLFKPFSAVHAILSDKPPEQLQYIDQAMRELRGVSLEKALIHAYGGSYITRVRWLIEGDRVGSLAMNASRVASSWLNTKNGRADQLRELYEQVPTRDIARFERLVARELKIEKDHVLDYLRTRISARGVEKLDAIRHGDILTERVIHIHDLLHSKGARQLELRKSFRNMQPDELKDFSSRYQARYGSALKDEIAARMRPSAARDLCLAVIDQDRALIAAAQIRCAFEYRADFIGRPFLNTSDEERTWMISAYEKVYHHGKNEFWMDLRRAAWREDFLLAKIPHFAPFLESLTWPGTTSYTFLESIVRNGKLSSAELLRYFMSGIGTDIDGIYAVLSDRTRQEVQHIEADYAKRYTPTSLVRFVSRIPLFNDLVLTGDLRHDLRVELSGDQEFDILLYMEGLPNDRDEAAMSYRLLERIKQRYEHERSGPLMRLRRGLLSKLRGDGLIINQFEADFKRATDYYDSHIQDGKDLSARTIKRFSTLVRLAEIQADAYREAKVAISDLVLNSGAFIGATLGAASVIMITALPWWTGPIATGLGSLCWRWLQGRLVLGRGFGKTDATFQAIRAFIDGASLFTIKAGVATFSELLGRQLSGAATKGGFKTSLHRFIKSIEEGIKRQNKARHVLEKGTALASDSELEELRLAFYDEIKSDPATLHSTGLSGGVSIQQVIAEALK